MIAKKSLYLLIFCTAFLWFGCAAPRTSMYYWGGYSNSLYTCRITPSEENLIKHKQVLENIIEESNMRNLRVPPGVYSELGYIYFRENRNEEAIKYYEMEARIYPESAVFMQRLTQAANAKGDGDKKKDKLPAKD